MKKIFLIILLPITQLLIANNNLQQQLAQFEVSLAALNTQLGPAPLDRTKILIDTVDAIENLEKSLKSLIHNIGIMIVASLEEKDEKQEEQKVINFIQNDLSLATNELIKYINLLPQAAQTGEENKKIALYLLEYLEHEFDTSITPEYLTAYALYIFQSPNFPTLHALLGFAATLNDTELAITFNNLAVKHQGIQIPETFIFVDYNINLDEDLSDIKKASKKVYKDVALKIHPDKKPKSSNADLNEKLNNFSESRFKILSTDLDTVIKQSEDIAQFLVDVTKKAFEIGNLFVPQVESTTIPLEQLRKQLYASIKNAQDALAQLP